MVNAGFVAPPPASPAPPPSPPPNVLLMLHLDHSLALSLYLAISAHISQVLLMLDLENYEKGSITFQAYLPYISPYLPYTSPI